MCMYVCGYVRACAYVCKGKCTCVELFYFLGKKKKPKIRKIQEKRNKPKIGKIQEKKGVENKNAFERTQCLIAQ